MENLSLPHLWKQYPSFITDKENQNPAQITKIEKLLVDMLSVGEYYFFTLELADGKISDCSESITKIHPLKDYPSHISHLFKLIHPEDQDYVLQAEKMCIEKLVQLDITKALHYKASYCFRMLTPDGYQLFHHQAIVIMLDENHRIIKALNIHTNIHHLTPINNKSILISGFGSNSEYHYLTIDNAEINEPETHLTLREHEVLQLIALGFSSEEIADKLSVSVHTIKTHRKNILSKTQTKNSSELIKKCVEWGLI